MIINVCVLEKLFLFFYNEFDMETKSVMTFVLGAAAGLIISALLRKKEKHPLEKKMTTIN
jgi:hypothetical protein